MISFMNWIKPDEDEVGSRASSLGGYLWKLKQGNRLLVPQWTKRWFSIEGKFLRYYEYANSEEYSGSIDLRTVDSIQRVDSVVQGAFSFCISCPERKYILRAASNAEVSKWIRALRSQADLARGGYGMGLIFDSPNDPATVAGKGRKCGSGTVAKSLEKELDRTLEKLNALEKGVLLNPSSHSFSTKIDRSAFAASTRKSSSPQASFSARDDDSLESSETVDEDKRHTAREVSESTSGWSSRGSKPPPRTTSIESLGDDAPIRSPVRSIASNTTTQSGNKSLFVQRSDPSNREQRSSQRYEEDLIDAYMKKSYPLGKLPSRPTSSNTTVSSSRPDSADISGRTMTLTRDSREDLAGDVSMSCSVVPSKEYSLSKDDDDDDLDKYIRRRPKKGSGDKYMHK